MNAPEVHECPDGSRMRITAIQTIRDDALFEGERFTFQVEPVDDEDGEGVDDTFDVTVEYAPIFVGMASPQDRLLLDTWAEELVGALVDRGIRESTRLRITSDGAIVHADRVLGRVHRLTKSA